MHRRSFLQTLGALSGSACLLRSSPASPFKVGAITDGFSQDFGDALRVMKSYGLHWVEIRQVFGIYNTDASPEQVRSMKELVRQYGFRVSVIDSAFYKCTLPGTAPIVKEKDTYPYKQQMDVLKRAFDRAQDFGTDKVRIFTFWRVSQPQTVFDRTADELRKATEVAKASGIRLVIENEEACNVGDRP